MDELQRVYLILHFYGGRFVRKIDLKNRPNFDRLLKVDKIGRLLTTFGQNDQNRQTRPNLANFDGVGQNRPFRAILTKNPVMRGPNPPGFGPNFPAQIRAKCLDFDQNSEIFPDFG